MASVNQTLTSNLVLQTDPLAAAVRVAPPVPTFAFRSSRDSGLLDANFNLDLNVGFGLRLGLRMLDDRLNLNLRLSQNGQDGHVLILGDLHPLAIDIDLMNVLVHVSRPSATLDITNFITIIGSDGKFVNL